MRVFYFFLVASIIFGSHSLQGQNRKFSKNKNQKVGNSFFNFTPDTIRYRKGSVYIGGIKDGQLNGRGILLDPYGDTLYVGEFINGRKEGFGRYYFKNGNIYNGQWHENHMHGKGSMKFKSGDFYEGAWYHDQRHGKGVYKYADGSVYEGEFANGIVQGHGQMMKDDLSYTGDWLKGLKNGQGYLVISGPDQYEEYRGEFLLGKYHGKGYWKHEKDGITTIYNGNWRDGRRYGEGTYSINGREVKGVWLENECTGKGTCTTKEGSYEGKFKRGFFDGEGKMEYANGNIYEGDFIRGRRQGYGIMTFKKNGNTYEGSWYMDKPNGHGKMTYASGKTLIGQFRDGEYIGR